MYESVIDSVKTRWPSPWRWTINWYASIRKVVTMTFECMTFKIPKMLIW